MTSSSHIFPPLETHEDHYFSFHSSPSQTSLSSPSSLLIRPLAIYPSQYQDGRYHTQILKQYQQSQEVDEYGSLGGSSDQQSLSPPSHSTLDSGSENGVKLSICEGDQHKDDSPTSDKRPVSWMSSKMRLMKKMINSDRSMDAEKQIRSKLWFQDQKQSSPSVIINTTDDLVSNSAVIRTCSDCNTTRTPLWRSGPKGPKSLCNACGIRQRKARRALAAATSAANNGVLATDGSSTQTKVHCAKKKQGKGHASQHKKLCKDSVSPCIQKNNGFEEFIVNLSSNLALHRVIPQDETEAAILLMALSCGLVSR